MQEVRDSIKRPNLRIMGIEEEEVQARGIHNILKFSTSPEHHADLIKIVSPP
jgi:hypothetical protein